MKRKSLDADSCPIARSLDQVGAWWSLLIVRDVATGKRRFGELLESLGVARNILSTRLKQLVASGILESRPSAAGGAYQEYGLTEKGRDLCVTLIALAQWGDRWLSEGCGAEVMFADKATGEEIPHIALRARDGRALAVTDIAVLPRPKAPEQRTDESKITADAA